MTSLVIISDTKKGTDFKSVPFFVFNVFFYTAHLLILIYGNISSKEVMPLKNFSFAESERVFIPFYIAGFSICLKYST